jgi:hypothetical protein
MGYLNTGGDEAASDSDELKDQGLTLDSIDAELNSQGDTLDSINSGVSSGNSTLTQIQSNTSSISSIATDTTSIDGTLTDIETEVLAQGVVQDTELQEQRNLIHLIKQSELNQRIIIRHLEIITEEKITERDLI